MRSEEIIKDVIKKVMDKSEIEIDMRTDFNEIGLNSITFIYVVVELEDILAIEFEDDYLDYGRYKTFEEFCVYVEKLQKKSMVE